MISRSPGWVHFNDLPAPATLEPLISVVSQGRPVDWLSDYPSTMDLHELLALDEVRKRTIAWKNVNGKINAFCIVDPYNNMLFECTEDSNYQAYFHEAVQFGCAVIREKFRNKKEIPTIDASYRGDDFQRIDCLESEGFYRDSFESVTFNRSLNDPLNPPVIPDGFVIRPLAGEQELNTYVDLHRKAFGTDQMTREFRQSIMVSPEYNPQLDLVAQSPEGRLAAFCVCQINSSENAAKGEAAGMTDPVGVHPDFRGRGLAKALMQEGLIQLKIRGMDSARLCTRSDNTAMIGLARFMGFKEIYRKIWFSRKVG